MATFAWRQTAKKMITPTDALGAANWAINAGIWAGAAADIDKIFIKRRDDGGSPVYSILLEGQEIITDHTSWPVGEQIIGFDNGNPIRSLKAERDLTAQEVSDIATWIGTQSIWTGALADIDEILLGRRGNAFILRVTGERNTAPGSTPVGVRIIRVDP